MARKPPKGKSLAEVNPEIAKEWHPTNNGDLTPFDFTIGSKKKVWWKCEKGEDHEWEAIIYSRKNNGCSICSGRKVVLSNCLTTTYPELAKEWHPTKNGDLTPNDITSGSNKKIWWKCNKGADHEWLVSPNRRTHDVNKIRGCPVCAGQKLVLSNCLATTHPELAKEWHPTKNGDFTPLNTHPGTHREIWWKCNKGDDHEWKAQVVSRTRQQSNCLVCIGQKVVLSNCLATTHPAIAKEWHPTKNGDFTPFDVTAGSDKKVWWKCSKGDDHEWETSVGHRSAGNGCAVCAGYKVVLSNCLSTTHPEIAKEWHPTKNGDLTPYDITAGSKKYVWWKCNKGDDHEWQTTAGSRYYQGSGCPYCHLTPQSRQELTITFELLKIFKDINPKGFKTRVDGKLWTIDIYIPQLHLGIEFIILV